MQKSSHKGRTKEYNNILILNRANAPELLEYRKTTAAAATLFAAVLDRRVVVVA